MYHTPITYQTYLSSYDKGKCLLQAIRAYRVSPFFRDGLQAGAYFRGENPAIAQKTVLRASKVETTDASGRRRVRTRMKDVVGSRVYSGFFGRFVTQQAQYLLGNGVTLGDPGLKARLGADFDLTLARMGEKALQHGVCWGYWNTDHLEIVEAVRAPYSGFFPLIDEVSGEARMGVQFWQLEARSPLCVRLFEPQGVSMWREEKGQLVPAGRFPPLPAHPPGERAGHGAGGRGGAGPAAGALLGQRGAPQRADAGHPLQDRLLRPHPLGLRRQPRPRQRRLLGAEQLRRHGGRHRGGAGDHPEAEGRDEPLRRHGHHRHRRAAHHQRAL